MSKLDEIYFDTHYAIPPEGKLFVINVNNDLVYQAFRDELKTLLLEIIGEDEQEGIDRSSMDDVAIGANDARAEIRARVEAL